ncbi:MAG: division/cell wall cluster transcriptional repressor MraZ [Actinomycetota bacterium]|nr:division/cell wall cluster transcriptional repressor MraZ [Actinomycetota bacterium]
MAQLLGEHRYQMDAKGRISLPQRFREAFAEGAYLTLGQDGCVYAFAQERWDRESERLNELALSESKTRAYQRMFFGNAERVELDSQGRMVLPRKLRDSVGLGREVIVLGVSDRLEIWSKEAWERYEAGHAMAYSNGTLRPERAE